MKKNIRFIKAMFKKLGAPIVLLLGLILGFVADRVSTLLTAGSHRSASHHTVRASLPAPAAPCQLAAAHHHESPQAKAAHRKHRAAHIAKAHHKHAKRHKLASAKKHRGKKSLRVADSN